MDQTPQTGEHGDDDQDGRRDLDAEFAALMDDVELPDDLSAVEGLQAPEGSRDGSTGDRAQDGQSEAASSSVGDTKDTEPAGVSPDDVPHNTYHPLDAPGERTCAADEPSRLTDAQEAQIAAAADSLSSFSPGDSNEQAPKAVKVAVVMTPLNRADGLAGMCSLMDLDCTVVPSSSGAFAVKQFVSAHSDWDVAELLGGSDSEPAEAAELAAQLSRLSRAGAVLMTADLATDVGIESGLSGTITARHFTNGQPGEEASAGLLLASMDQVVEDVLLGAIDADDVPGAVKSSEIKAPRAMRWFGRGLRRPPQ
ncbi:hypothetical protein [Actinomyces viscosus]|uniref:Uncharacterized protein n=1 Tax=Actinomyces viscosus TaxID=1656 RepID=A0A3S4VJ63_ACTVI|nr:hypothetical protein [Actinomyces viscosus]VEI15222.1 Uncharacterised protein [Actinomyces viscosus]